MATKLTYAQIVQQITSLWIGPVEKRLETGRLVAEAVKLGKSPADVAVDVGMSGARLTAFMRVWQFWKNDRIPGCNTFGHYERVAIAKDRALQAKLISFGDVLCIKTTVDASGRTKNFREKIAEAESAVNTAIIILNALKTPLTSQQAEMLRARVDGLRNLIDQRVEYVPAAPIPAVRTSGYQISPVRTWALANGFPVGRKGKLAQHIVNAYQAAHSHPRVEAWA